MNRYRLREQPIFAKKPYIESVVKCVWYGCSPFWDCREFCDRSSEVRSFPEMIGVVSGVKVNQLNRITL